MTWDQLIDRFATASVPWEVGANVLLQTTLVLSAGLVAGRLCKPGGAAVQSLIYRATLVAVLVCPLVACGFAAAGLDCLLFDIEPFFAPQVAEPRIEAQPHTVQNLASELPLEHAPPRNDAEAFVAPAASEIAEVATTPHPRDAVVAWQPPQTPSPLAAARIDEAPQQAVQAGANAGAVIAILAGAVWLFLSTFLLIRLAFGQWRTVRIRRLAIPAEEMEVALCRQIAAEFHVRPPEILRAPFITSACLVGHWRPAVLLPDADETSLRQTLVHELAHLSRHDCLWNMLRQLATALIPIQPLVWLLGRRIEQTAEEVCDDIVVQHSADRCGYAELLVELASRNLPSVLPAGVGMISFRSLSARRIARILDASRTLSTRVRGRAIAAILLIAASGTLVTASLGVGAGQAQLADEQEAQRQQNEELSVATTDPTTAAPRKNALTIRGQGPKREMLVKGRVVDAEGRPARDYELHASLRKDYDREALSPKMDGDRFEVWVPMGGFYLSASTKDGTQRAYQSIRNWSLRQASIEGIELTLAAANRTVEVLVMKDGVAVTNAHVTADLQGNVTLQSETNAEGKATFHLLENEQFSQLTAWTDDFQLGGFAFYRKPYHDPLGHEFTIELEKCREQTIRLIRADDGSPLASVPFALTIGTGPPNYNFPGNWATLPQAKMTTNEKGEAVYRWFPDWKQHALEIYVLDPKWAKAESDRAIEVADDGAYVVKLKSRTERKPLFGRVASDGLNVDGLGVEIWTFQGEEENRSDHLYAVTDADGRFTADCIPGSTYCMYVADERYASEIVDLIPYDPDTGTANSALLHLSEGKPVEIRVTSGPNHEPMRNQWVYLHVPHDYSWRESGETRHGRGGRQWGIWTDDKGIARARALAGAELTASVVAGEWRSREQKVTVKAGGVTTIDIHRGITTEREVTGQLIAPPGMAVNLANAEVVLGSINGETDERVTTKTNARGGFAFKTKALQFGIFAYAADGKAAGIATPQNGDQQIEIQLNSTADLRGRLLDKEGKPIVEHTVRTEAQVTAKERRRDVSFGMSFVAKTFETTTDSNGNYNMKGLPCDLAMTLRAVPIHGTQDVGLERFILRAGEDRPPMVSRLGAIPEAERQTVPERFKSALRDAVLGDFHVMVLIFDSTAKDFVDANLLDYDKTKEVGSFMQLEIRDSDLVNAAAAQFVSTKKWPTPRPRAVFAIALDASGTELGRVELDTTQADAAGKAADFIRKHAPAPKDAKEKWTAAFAEAKRSNRKVWARVSQRFCGPCLLMSRWSDDHHELLNRDYVLLKIDNVRDTHGDEVAKRITNNRSEFGVPFSAIFDANEKLLIDSEGPLGNIGHPSGYEGRRHLKRMLGETRSRLSLEQVEQIVNTVGD